MEARLKNHMVVSIDTEKDFNMKSPTTFTKQNFDENWNRRILLQTG